MTTFAEKRTSRDLSQDPDINYHGGHNGREAMLPVMGKELKDIRWRQNKAPMPKNQ